MKSDNAVDREVARLLMVGSAANDGVRLPRSESELAMALKPKVFRQEEKRLLRVAAQMGPAVRIGFEDRLLAGASVQSLYDFLRDAASSVADDLRRRLGDADGDEVASGILAMAEDRSGVSRDRFVALAEDDHDVDDDDAAEVDRYLALVEGGGR